MESVKSSLVQRLHWPALSTIFRPWTSITAASASRSRWTRNSIAIGRGFLSKLSSGPTIVAVAVSSSNVSRDRLPPPSSSGFGRSVLGEVLVGAVSAQHVRRAHAADAAVVAVMRRAGRVVGRQVVERRGHARRVEVIPERHALPPEHGGGRLVVERPEIELEPVVADLPARPRRESSRRRSRTGRTAPAGWRWMKSKIPWAPGPAPLMKLAQATGLCGGVLVPSGLKPPPARSLSRLGSRPSFIMRSESRGSMPSMPMTITFLPALRERVPRAPSQ